MLNYTTCNVLISFCDFSQRHIFIFVLFLFCLFGRVRGVQGLRVIDASIMPYLPSANSSAPTIMVAEKGVAYITKEHDAIVQLLNNNNTYVKPVIS